MLKKTITYTDYDGKKHTEDFYFNLNKRELANMELKNYGGFEGLIRQIVNTTDVPKLTSLFEEIVLQSYGEKSADGKRFIKEEGRLAKEFVETEAYVELYMELIQDPDKLAAFVNGIVPADMAQQMDSPEVKKKIEEFKANNRIDLPTANART